MHRRTFIRASVGGSGALILRSETAFGSQANSAVELGLIGCGTRGNWISDLAVEHTGARIVALADVFDDRLKIAQAKYKVDAARLHPGLAGHLGLVNSKMDGVIIETPPYYHPEQAAAAVDAGKHVFMAKPVAVDVPGCRSIQASGEKAKGKVSFLVDFQTRAQPVFQEAAARVHRGDIGTPVLGHVYYHAAGGDPKPPAGLTPSEARLRMWTRDRALSGDIIVEQNIHVLDVANWYLKAHPVRARGTGGRKVRSAYGDCWDYFVVTFWYPNEVVVDFSSAQFLKGFYDMCIRLYGPAGTIDSHYGRARSGGIDQYYNGYVKILGERPWNGADHDDTFTQGAIANLKQFVDSIRTGEYVNNAAESVISNLTSILGRSAGYRGGTVTWDEMLDLNTKLEPGLRL